MVSLAKRAVKSQIPEVGIIKLKQLRSSINRLVLKVRNFCDELVLQLCVRSPLLSSLYYTFTSPAFRKEHHGVIYGKLKYAENLKLAQDSNYLLRRNIHRLEKGLIMQPRRDIFASEYIVETVESYKNALLARQNCSPTDELQWAHDVLQQYFKVVPCEPTIDQAREKFFRLEPLCSNNPLVPYKRDLSNLSSVSYDQFLALCYRRRSVRWYLQKPVLRDLLDQAIAAANLSPSACNRQPFEFRIFDEPELVQKVSSVPMGTKGFHHNFPAIVVVVGKLRAYFSERDRHVIYIDGALASMSFMYALETLGLSSCPINWPDMEPQENQMAALLNLEPDERVIMLISVGYPDPDGMVPYSQKKPLHQIRRYNEL